MILFGPPNIEKLKAKKDINSLLKALSYKKDSYIRYQAAKALGEIGDMRAVDVLIISLRDSNGSVRQGAAEALGMIGDARAVESLIATLKDDNENVRKSVVEALGKTGDERAVEALIAAIKDSAPSVRYVVAKVLGMIGNIRAVESLIVMLGDKDNRVSDGAVQALGGIGTPAVKFLVAALRDKHDNVRKGAVQALKKTNWQPGQDESSIWYWIVDGDIYQCVQIGVSAVEPLIAMLNQEDMKICADAAEALGKIGDFRAVEPLIAMLNQEDAIVCVSAAEALGKIKDTRAVEPLMTTVLQNENKDVCINAIDALGKIGAPSIKALSALLSECPDVHARMAAVEALGKIEDVRAEKSLIIALRDNEQGVCRLAADVLKKLGWKPGIDEDGAYYWIAMQDWEKCSQIGVPAVGPLIATLGDNDDKVRARGAKALGEIGDIRAVEPLIAALTDKDLDAKTSGENSAFVEALVKIGTPAVDALIVALEVGAWYARRDSAEVLGEIGDARAVEPLINALNDRAVEVRKRAIKALGKISDVRAREALIAILRSRDNYTRKNCAELLKEVGWQPGIDENGAYYWIAMQDWQRCSQIGSPAVDPLIFVLKDKDVTSRRGAAQALGKIGDARAIEPLIVALEDEDNTTRQNAIEALGKMGNLAVRPLIAKVKNGDWNIRDKATKALCKIGKPTIEPILTVFLDGDSYYRKNLAQILEELGWQPDLDENGAKYWIAMQDWEKCSQIGVPAVGPLIATLRDKEATMRQRVVEILDKIGDAGAVGPLVFALKDSNENVRMAAAKTLAKIGDAQSISQAIEQLLQNFSIMSLTQATILGQIRNKTDDVRITNLYNSLEGIVSHGQDLICENRSNPGSSNNLNDQIKHYFDSIKPYLVFERIRIQEIRESYASDHEDFAGPDEGVKQSDDYYPISGFCICGLPNGESDRKLEKGGSSRYVISAGTWSFVPGERTVWLLRNGSLLEVKTTELKGSFSETRYVSRSEYVWKSEQHILSMEYFVTSNLYTKGIRRCHERLLEIWNKLC